MSIALSAFCLNFSVVLQNNIFELDEICFYLSVCQSAFLLEIYVRGVGENPNCDTQINKRCYRIVKSSTLY